MTSQMQGHLAMLCFSALIAGSFALGVQTANEISPIAFTALRFALASLLVGAVAFGMGRVRRQDAQAPWRYVILGGLIGSYMVLMFEGLKTAPAVSAAAVFTLTPAIAGVVGWIVLRQITTRSMAIAIAIGGAGALWVIFRADLSAFLAFEVGRGEMIYFVGCIAHAIYSAMIPRLNRGESPISFTFGTLLVGTVFVTALGIPDILATDWTALPMIVWITLIYVVVFATAMTFWLIQFSALRLPAAKVMAYTYLTPSWVVVWMVALGQPVPDAMLLIGVGLTIVALLMLLRDDGAAIPIKDQRTARPALVRETSQTSPD